MLEYDGKIACFITSWKADYIINSEHCELTTVGKLHVREVALAVPKGSIWLSTFDECLAKLKKSGDFEALMEKWWQVGQCTVSASASHRATAVTFVTIVGLLVKSMT